MKRGRLWTRDELLPVINLYCKTPFGRIHQRNPDIIKLAAKLDRSPGSVSYKMANLAALDESLDRVGAKNASQLDRDVWNEFFGNIEKHIAEIEAPNIEEEPTKVGEDRVRETKVRVNQDFFRKTILASYENRCCITGVSHRPLLRASHILPWSKSEEHRLNPRNGLCLNALHDSAFDSGFLTLDPDLMVRVSPIVSKRPTTGDSEMLLRYEGKKIVLPKKFLPDEEFLSWHRVNVFKS